MLEANRTDFERNARLAEQFRERAQAARERRQEELYERNMVIARAFRELAECNRMIVEGIRDHDHDKMSEAFEKVPELEAIIIEHTRRRPARDWLTPDELRRFRRRTAVQE